MKGKTFEDFKKEMEPFYPEFTPQTLAFLKHQYKAHVQHWEDAQYLEPVDIDDKDGLGDPLQNKLKAYLQWAQIKEGEVHVIVLPSFETEYLVSIQQMRVLITTFPRSIWPSLYPETKENPTNRTERIYDHNLIGKSHRS